MRSLALGRSTKICLVRPKNDVLRRLAEYALDATLWKTFKLLDALLIARDLTDRVL